MAGVTGRGIRKNILDGHRYLVHNHAPGDRVFLFGYSRGAYTLHRQLADLRVQVPDRRLVLPAALQSGPRDTSSRPSTACRFQALTWLGCILWRAPVAGTV